MILDQRKPWRIVIAAIGCFIAWMFGAFEPPAQGVPKQPASEVAKTPAPMVSTPPELTPEQKAERAAQKARDDEENLRFARDVAVVRQLKSSMKNPASFDLVNAPHG